MDTVDKTNFVVLPRNTNQAAGIAQYAIDFLAQKLGPGPSEAVLKRAELFHTDSVFCGLSAIALGTSAPIILRDEALEYPVSDQTKGGTVFGSSQPEKAVVANSSAVREWDSNGTVFGYNQKLGHIAGEFGHNDFYPVVIVACQQRGFDGKVALRAMVLLDEIRGRLAEVFPLNKYKIDHVVHGAIASAAVYGALLDASAEQIEHAIGMVVAHYIPWRAIRAGKQLSDSKGASAALSTEVAILSVKRALKGFIGPKDIFRNPEALWRRFQPTNGDSPFDLVLAHSGDDFAIMGMHFKMGLYEHQSAGALHGVITLLTQNPSLANGGLENIKSIKIVAYEPAFGIIGDPAKRNPQTRQSADHSMVYIVATLLRKALESKEIAQDTNSLWKQLMLMPHDYSHEAINNAHTRKLMDSIQFEHGGKEYDEKYPDGIPTSLVITDTNGKHYDSGLVMYPAGHARNTTNDLNGILEHKFKLLGRLAFDQDQQVVEILQRFNNLASKSKEEIAQINNFPLTVKGKFD
jgi:2-methylcitrate dehydratase